MDIYSYTFAVLFIKVNYLLIYEIYAHYLIQRIVSSKSMANTCDKVNFTPSDCKWNKLFLKGTGLSYVECEVHFLL